MDHIAKFDQEKRRTVLCRSDLTCTVLNMNRRNHTSAVIRAIRAQVIATGSEAKVAQAADMDLSRLNARLDEVDEFTVAEIVQVGGFFAFTPAQLFTEAA